MNENGDDEEEESDDDDWLGWPLPICSSSKFR